MANPENVNSSEKLDSQQETQEQLANQKFDEIFNKIYVVGNSFEDKFAKYSSIDLKREDGATGGIQLTENIKTGAKNMDIYWHEYNDKPGSTYNLSKEGGKYTLVSGFDKKNTEDERNDVHERNEVSNLTPEELLNNILPNFEKRLNEGEMLRVQERQRVLGDANQYAYQQDQQDADRLLQENGLA